ncbi:efflux RND transporter permease subunit [endosymbiont of Ridgeia piscesae]|jgi:multidrug efflux pump subunit AcrB|uniref:4a-hydroxytetrahydrobiopterin dehydratase n=1 Tax=endosymbiont of Ridgeia piscesae TaxID=54398 RepID=A0A0T5ZB91_9GAMM|nr:efflux RND transporter permease subunit [endosymbiont of Ridgeia piscesae]KRT56543.1 hypothetical protein Ga0074115_1539 [endosymbiont of Ridgeia piscesae]KRT60092.1 hypothetical protein Ga0076813_16654 [endosymbiont of Ridgeia piscesae]
MPKAETDRAALSWQGSDYQPTIDISVKKLPGFDSLKLIEQLKQVMAEQRSHPTWPHGVEYTITSD